VFIKREEYERVEPLLRESLKALTERPLPGNIAVGEAHALLGRVLLREKRYPEAEEHLTVAYAILANRPITMLRRVREDLAALKKLLNFAQSLPTARNLSNDSRELVSRRGCPRGICSIF
jgi:uncharacterized protein HemY